MSLNLWFSDLNKTIVATIIVKYRLADYGKWKIFSEDLKTCNHSYGWIGYRVFLDPADHSTVVMVNRFKETENAKAKFKSHILSALKGTSQEAEKKD